MIKILAIGTHIELKTIQRRLAVRHSVELTVARYSDIEIFLEQGSAQIKCKNKDIGEYDFVWLNSSWATRALAYSLAIYFQAKHIAYTRVEMEKSKLVDFMELALHNVEIPKTYFATTRTLEKRLKHLVRFLHYPFIIKTTRGSLGKGVYLIKDEAHFHLQKQQLWNSQQYICQEYIPNDFDYRIIVADHTTIVSSEQRIRVSDSFRNNAHLGAKEIFLDIDTIPKPVSQIALRSAKALGLNWTGVDIVTSKETGKSYVLELNRTPGLNKDTSETQAAYDFILDLLQIKNPDKK